MAELTVRLKDGITATEVEADLPDDCEIKDLLPAVVNQLNVTAAENMKLRNKTQGFEYNENDTLASRNTKANDQCLLTYEPTQGCIEVS